MLFHIVESSPNGRIWHMQTPIFITVRADSVVWWSRGPAPHNNCISISSKTCMPEVSLFMCLQGYQHWLTNTGLQARGTAWCHQRLSYHKLHMVRTRDDLWLPHQSWKWKRIKQELGCETTGPVHVKPWLETTVVRTFHVQPRARCSTKHNPCQTPQTTAASHTSMDTSSLVMHGGVERWCSRFRTLWPSVKSTTLDELQPHWTFCVGQVGKLHERMPKAGHISMSTTRATWPTLYLQIQRTSAIGQCLRATCHNVRQSSWSPMAGW